LLTKTHN